MLQQCIVKYNKPYNAYDILLSFQESFNNVHMFFDTGASKQLQESLLGNDFLYHCSYAHKTNDDIIEYFNSKSYEEYFKRITDYDLEHQSLDLRSLLDKLESFDLENSLCESGAKSCFAFLKK